MARRHESTWTCAFSTLDGGVRRANAGHGGASPTKMSAAWTRGGRGCAWRCGWEAFRRFEVDLAWRLRSVDRPPAGADVRRQRRLPPPQPGAGSARAAAVQPARDRQPPRLDARRAVAALRHLAAPRGPAALGRSASSTSAATWTSTTSAAGSRRGRCSAPARSSCFPPRDVPGPAAGPVCRTSRCATPRPGRRTRTASRNCWRPTGRPGPPAALRLARPATCAGRATRS